MRKFLALLAVGGWVLPSRLNAEGFFDLYGGNARNGAADASITRTDTNSGSLTESAHIPLGNSGEAGARLGGYIGKIPWFGFGVDVGATNVSAENKDLKAHLISFSYFLAARVPLLRNPDCPGGRIQPYAMAGISIIMTHLSMRINTLGESGDLGESTGGLASKNPRSPYLVLGLAWQFSKRAALFGEIRHTSFEGDGEFVKSYFFPTTVDSVHLSFSSTHYLAGISWRFGFPRPRKPAPPPEGSREKSTPAQKEIPSGDPGPGGNIPEWR